jgi:hypothetical protein
MIDEVRF